MNIDADVIIIGAGAAGIAAAIELQKANLTFLILEARNRIGGRAYTDDQTFSSIPIDLGASWIHSYGPDNVLHDYYQSLNTNNDSYQLSGTSIWVDYDGQSFPNDIFFQARIICSEIYTYLEHFTYNNKHNEDKNIEEVILSEYQRLVPMEGQTKRLVDLLISGEEQYEGSNLKDLSAKYWDTGTGTGCDLWVTSGYGNLLEKIANKHNLPIRLNSFVTHINTIDNNRIAIRLLNNSSIIYCRRVIVTIPLGCLKKDTILFEPALPDWKREAFNEMGVGLMNKLILQFENNFWNLNARSILHASNQQRGQFRFTICIPPPANILILFVTGSFAHKLETLTDIEILEEVMKFLRQIFPGKNVPNPINYKFTRWFQDPLSCGSFSNFSVHSGPHTIEQLAKPTSDGRVQWAGEHTNINDGNSDWTYACVHSAFQSGQRAAKAIRDQLYN